MIVVDVFCNSLRNQVRSCSLLSSANDRNDSIEERTFEYRCGSFLTFGVGLRFFSAEDSSVLHKRVVVVVLCSHGTKSTYIYGTCIAISAYNLRVFVCVFY